MTVERIGKQTLAVVVWLSLSCPVMVSGQWSMDFPGVPRARVPFLSGGDGRFELDITGYRLRAEESDTVAGSLRIGFGNSWRLGSKFELGYDVSLGELRTIRPGGTSPVEPSQLSGTVVYGGRVGLKFQPYRVVDPDGYGLAVAFGVAYRPEVLQVFTYSKTGNITTTGGYAGARPPDGELKKVVTATQSAMGSVSYRVRRLDLDAALTYVRVVQPSGEPILPSYPGAALAVGARVYLTSSFGIGASYWGSGPPPWQDRIGVDVRSSSLPKFGFLLTLGGNIDGGTDIMVYSPTGDFSESISFYLRAR
jgi:hypothetical protein